MAAQNDTASTMQQLRDELAATQTQLTAATAAASLATYAPGNQLQGGLPPNQAPRAAPFALSPALAIAGEFVDIGPPPIAAA